MRQNRWILNAIFSVSLMSFYSVSLAKADKPVGESYRKTGVASIYNDRYHGKTTSSGEAYDRNAMTAAHNSLPLGATVRVTNLHNNQAVVVRVNDRMRKSNSRLIDLSKQAARKLGFISAGLAKVKIEVLSI